MKIIKVIYNETTDYILDIVQQFSTGIYVETFNTDHYKEKKKAIPIMTRHGTTNVPLLVFEDENLEEYAAIWSELNPDWKKEINKVLLNE